MSSISSNRPVSVTLAAVLLSTVALTACGASSKASPGASSAAANPSAAPSGSVGEGRMNQFANPQVQQCLSAAGIAVPTFSAGARPSGSRSFTGAPPSGVRPSGVRPSGANGFGNSAQNQKIQQALTACGITFGARPSGTPTG